MLRLGQILKARSAPIGGGLRTGFGKFSHCGISFLEMALLDKDLLVQAHELLIIREPDNFRT